MQFNKHLEQCPLQVIECPFTSAGCTVQLPRREMEEHEKEAVHQHLRMMISMLQLKPESKEPAVTTKQSQYLVNLPPVEFAITDFMKKKKCNAEWMSPPFYTHPQGYKFCLVVYPNGLHGGSNTHLSLCVLLLEEEDNHDLVWPLEVSFMIELLNWREDNQNYQEIIEFNSASNLVSKKGKRSLISSLFSLHSSLSYNSTTNTEYLQNDCVRLRVNKVVVYSTALLSKTPSWQNPHNGYQSLYKFTLTDFSNRKYFDNEHCSSPFYTHQHGYKMCLRIFSNGCDSSNDTHVSVYVTLMTGEYDDQLEWPFVGKIDIYLLNWRKNEGHHMMTIPIAADNEFARVIEGTFGGLLGYVAFIAHLSLAYPIAITEYLQEDCLRFRVNVHTN